MTNKKFSPILSGEDTGKTLKLILKRLKEIDKSKIESPETYGCLQCKYFQRKEGYNQQWGIFAFFYYKCKKQPNRNMQNSDNRYDIFDVCPDYNPHFHYNKAKGKCPYFKRGENELIYMSKEEKEKLKSGAI